MTDLVQRQAAEPRESRTRVQLSVQTIVLYAVALGMCVLITAASFPGFMSYDSLEALRQAREGVVGGPYPPFGAYVWRVFDSIWPGPTLMQFAQNILLAGSFAYIVGKARLPLAIGVLSVIFFLLLPPVFGIMLVVWKDVAVAASLLAAFAFLMRADQRTAGRKAACIAASALLFSGMAFRYNAGSAVLPLATYLAWTLIREGGVRQRVVKAVATGTALTFVLFGIVQFVNSHRFPTMAPLQASENLSYTQNYDLIGISAHAPESVVPDGAGSYVPVAYLRKIYDPVHINKTTDNDVQHLVHPVPDVSERWRDAIRKYPRAYFQHRSDVFGELLDYHDRPVYYPTHPSVDPNPYGYTYVPSALSGLAVRFVSKAANGWISRPWIYLSGGGLIVVLMYLFRLRAYRLEALTVYTSGLLYVLPMYFITPAADLRYSFWAICACVVAMVLSLASVFEQVRQSRRHKNRTA